MGYMGFGMRKEVYTRKPKVPFKKMKQLYGDKLEDYYRLNKKVKEKRRQMNAEEKEEIKRMVRKIVVRENTVNTIMIIATLIIFGLALYIAYLKLLKVG